MLSKEYRTILGNTTAEMEIKKSLFISDIKHCNSEEEAVEFINEIKSKHRQANHVCSAYIIGENKLIQRYNDDGEPQGTAGIPMLEVLKKEDLTNLCVTVTRYFGGIKLGASGLIRAYSKACSNAIDASNDVNMINYKKVSIGLDYTLLGKIENYLINGKFFEIEKNYTDKVEILLYIRSDEFDEFKSDLTDMTSGTCQIEVTKDLLLAEKNRKIIEGE